MSTPWTFAALHERIYDGSDTGAAVLAACDPVTRTAWRVLRNLKGRSGFDHWFHELGEGLQNEIFEELRTTIQAAMPAGRTFE